MSFYRGFVFREAFFLLEDDCKVADISSLATRRRRRGKARAATAALVDAYWFLCRDLPLPPRYRTRAYYLVRGLIIVLAGTLPWAFGAHDLRLAFALGAVAPSVIAHLPKLVIARWLASVAHDLQQGSGHWPGALPVPTRKDPQVANAPAPPHSARGSPSVSRTAEMIMATFARLPARVSSLALYEPRETKRRI